MTGLGEDVYTDRSTALGALTEESQRMGMYGDAPDVDTAAMMRETANAICRSHNVNPGQFTPAGGGERYGDLFVDDARAALESLGIPLSVLAELKAGTRKAVRVETFKLPSGREGHIPNVGDVFDAAPKYHGGRAMSDVSELVGRVLSELQEQNCKWDDDPRRWKASVDAGFLIECMRDEIVTLSGDLRETTLVALGLRAHIAKLAPVVEAARAAVADHEAYATHGSLEMDALRQALATLEASHD